MVCYTQDVSGRTSATDQSPTCAALSAAILQPEQAVISRTRPMWAIFLSCDHYILYTSPLQLQRGYQKRASTAIVYCTRANYKSRVEVFALCLYWFGLFRSLIEERPKSHPLRTLSSYIQPIFGYASLFEIC